jgi:cytochrome c2
MIKNKYGPNMVASDKQKLDEVIDGVIRSVGLNYGDVLEITTALLTEGDYSDALKYNAMNKTSWYITHIKSYVDTRKGRM